MYEQRARDRLVAVESRVAKLLEQEDYHQAAATYREFMEKFPLTLVAQEVDAELTHVESLREKHKQLLENELRKHRLEMDKLCKSYKLGWDVYQGLVRARSLDRALDQIEAVAEMV